MRPFVIAGRNCFVTLNSQGPFFSHFWLHNGENFLALLLMWFHLWQEKGLLSRYIFTIKSAWKGTLTITSLLSRILKDKKTFSKCNCAFSSPFIIRKKEVLLWKKSARKNFFVSFSSSYELVLLPHFGGFPLWLKTSFGSAVFFCLLQQGQEKSFS